MTVRPVHPSMTDASAHAPWLERLRAVLADRAALLAELERESERQDEHIRSRDTDALLALLSSRQRLVDRFVAGQAELLEVTSAFEDRAVELASADAHELRAAIDAISAGLARVGVRDEATSELLRGAREATREELERTERGSDARAAYARARLATPQAIYADRRG